LVNLKSEPHFIGRSPSRDRTQFDLFPIARLERTRQMSRCWSREQWLIRHSRWSSST